MLIEVDTAVGPDALEAVRGVPGVRDARTVSLG